MNRPRRRALQAFAAPVLAAPVLAARALAILVLAAQLLPAVARAAEFVLPPSCAAVTTPADDKTPIRELRKRVEAGNETDPAASFAILCTTIPRVAAKYGERSVEMAWWTASLATPLIAYMDKFDEALPALQFAQPILERHYGKYGEALGDIHVAYAWTYFRQGRLAESGAAWSEALKVRERAPGKNKIELQKVLVGLAQVQLSQREFALAERNLERAHGILVENHDTVSEAGAAIENALINVAVRQELYADARHHAEEQLRIEAQLKGGSAQMVPAYALLGRILERLNEYEQAEQALRRALELAEGLQGPLQRHHFSVQYQLAALLDERDRAAEAREHALRALSIGETTLGPAAPRLVPVLQILGDAEHRLGQLPDSLRRFERAGDIITAGRANVERPWLVAYYRDLGSLQMSLGDAAEAERTLAAGLDAAGEDPTLSVEHAWLLLEHSRAAGELGRYSRDELIQAAALLRTKLPESHPAILRVLNELCALELSTPAGAPNCAETADRLEHAPDTAPDLRAAIHDNQSRLAITRGDSAAARVYAVRAVAAAESTGMPEPLWQAYFQLAAVLRGRNETPLAIFFGKEALAQIESERSRFVGEDRRFDAGFLRDKVAAYRSVADWLLELGRVDEGLAVLQLMKTEEQRDFGVRDAALAPERGALLTDEESALERRYSQAVQADQAPGTELSRLSSLEEAGKISPAEREQLRMLLAGKGETEDARAARIEQLLQGTAGAAGADHDQQRAISAPALARAARSFGPDTAFAVYLLTEHHLRILVTARDAQEEFNIPIDAAQLQRDIGHFLDDVAQRRDTVALSGKLYDVIARRVDEFAAQHRAHRLALWLDGSLRYVPIAALHDGNRYLLDKYVIQIYTPASDSSRSSAPAHTAPWQVRGLGVTQSVAGFPALPAVADELCYVVHGPIEGLHSSSAACASPSAGNGALEGEGFADAAFTEQRLKDLVAGPRDFSVLHIGTHFRLRPGNALRSFLLLGDGSKLTLDEISALDFSAIDVVTLSACETGLGGARTDDGREIEGLSTLVQRRGAGRVIASLWQVEDASTAQLMHTLYTSFNAAHGDAALGLQQAQRAVRSLGSRNGRSYANPYYWAGFMVSGSRP
jgi:CHAT domain-containing protein/tetratricopeptide (TPR) repeat protein